MEHDLLSLRSSGSIFPRMTKKNNGWKSRISKIRWKMLIQADNRRLPVLYSRFVSCSCQFL